MAHLHHAELRPSKIELIAAWAPTQPWFEGASLATSEPASSEPASPNAATGDDGTALAKVATFRLDDPAGEVGIETLLVRDGDGPVLQVPLTYRAAPLEGAEASLVGTMQHSVLGTRYVYDGAGDPVYLAAVASAALTGGRQADEYFEEDGERVYRASTAEVVGSGDAGSDVPAVAEPREVVIANAPGATVITTKILRVVIARTLTPTAPDAASLRRLATAGESASEVLTAIWPEHPEPVPLLLVQRA
jgi:hypothetical protein